MQINLVNDTTQVAYLRFGSALPDGTYNGGTLDTATSYLIPAGGTLTGMDLEQFISGRMLFSLGGTLASSNPDFQYNSGDPSSQLRWDKLELSLFEPSDTLDASKINLTSTDFYGLDLQVQTFAPGSTVAAQTLTWNQSPLQVLTDLAAIANNDSAALPYVVVTGTNGLYVPSLNEDVLRVIAPSTTAPPGQPAYVSPQNYIDYIQNAGIATEVSGEFSRDGTSIPSDSQSYDFIATIPTVATDGAQPGDLLFLGEGGLVGPDQTIDIPGSLLAGGILSDNPGYFVNGHSAAIGDNDVYAAVAPGMLLPTVLGRRDAPIAWLGHRSVDCARHPQPASVWPFRVRRDAFGPGLPHTDLLLSPDHALLVEDVLVPVRYLANGTSIMQEPCDTVTYWHVELDQHDVILAAGLPAESYLDTGDRSSFANGGPVTALHPSFGGWTWDGTGCAPLVVTGEPVERARVSLQARAALVSQARLPTTGHAAKTA